MAGNNNLAIIDVRSAPLAVQTFGEERAVLLAEQIGRGWKAPPTPAEMEAIALICQQNRLDPFATPRQIHFVQRWDAKAKKDVMTPQVSIDGLRLIASRTREYGGQVGPQWCGQDGVWKDVWFAAGPPAAARVGVWRRGFKEPVWGLALWSEWVQEVDVYENDRKTGQKKPAPFWASKPAHMLAKTAEAIALKKAMPAETNSLELSLREELQRLEAPSLAARYAEIYGGDEDTAYAELPAPSTPLRERDVEDRAPEPAYSASDTTVNDAGEIVRRDTGEVVGQMTTAAAAAPYQFDRQTMLNTYDTLLTAAVLGEVIKRGDPEWTIAPEITDQELIKKGTDLRAKVNAYSLDRSRRANPPAAPEALEPTVAPRETVGVRTAIAQRHVELYQEAVALELPHADDFRVSFPADKEEVLRKTEQLEQLVDRAHLTYASGPAEQAAAF